MLGLLASDGYSMVDNPDEADVLIVNTCAFIDSAKQESIDTIFDMAQYKDKNCKLLIVTGCLAQRYKDEVLKEMPEVDYVLGTGEYDKICECIKKAFEGKREAYCGNPDRTPDDCLPRILTTPSYTAYLKIADGCDNNCTYCAIPKIRGHYRSRKKESIIEEARNLAESGVKEIILIAQDVSRYGIDLYGEYSLCALLDELVKIDGIEWIRLHYLYPEAITEELIDTIAKYDKICNYIDMPVQHGDDEILRRMARRTNQAEMRNRIKMIREKLPDVIIRTSIIVGFPGETEEQFEELCQFVQEIRFERLGCFPYSAEEGTPAGERTDQVDPEVRQRRADIIMDYLTEYHSVDIQWGNHDVLWMGAATGSRTLVATVLSNSIHYNNLEVIETGYGISLRPLSVFANEIYRDCDVHRFAVKLTGPDADQYSEKDKLLSARIHKAITIILFKLEGQKLLRHPEYGMSDRLLLDKIDYANKCITIGDTTYSLEDVDFPTVDPKDPYTLTPEEDAVINQLTASFLRSEKLHKHIRFLYSKGSLYKVFNGNLLFHACIPMTATGELLAFQLG